jgi:predicted nucleotidyltransferase
MECDLLMMREEVIMKRVREHYEEALENFPKEQIVGCFLQGSQNYGLDYEGSDVDTKLIVVPNFRDICLNKKPVSTTHVRANDEHTDWKDVRLYMETFRKQNLNFLEILFTKFYIINPMYEEEWNRLVEAREFIARMNEYRAVKSMKGIALEKYHAMEHEYPSKVDILKEWGYDPKQLHHLLRVEEYLERYMNGEPYVDCLNPRDPEYLISVKRGRYTLEEARKLADAAKAHVEAMSEEFCSTRSDVELGWCRDLLEDVSHNIMRIAVQKEFEV